MKSPVPVKEVVECFNTCKAAMEKKMPEGKQRKDEYPRLKE